jgi:hypothetical protein
MIGIVRPGGVGGSGEGRGRRGGGRPLRRAVHHEPVRGADPITQRYAERRRGDRSGRADPAQNGHQHPWSGLVDPGFDPCVDHCDDNDDDHRDHDDHRRDDHGRDDNDAGPTAHDDHHDGPADHHDHDPEALRSAVVLISPPGTARAGAGRIQVVTLSQEHQQFTPGNEPTIKFQSDATVKFQPVGPPPPFVPPPAQPVAPPVPQATPAAAAAPPAPATPAAPTTPAAPAAAKPAAPKPYVPRSAARRLARKILGPTLMTKRG